MMWLVIMRSTMWLLIMLACCDAAAVVKKDITDISDDSEDMVLDISRREGDVKLIGEHVCNEKVTVKTPVKVSYLAAIKEKEYEWCWKLTLRCPVWRTKMVNRERLENVTKVRNVEKCCAGYEEKEGFCVAVCEEGCLNGRCVEPERCECKAGYSGERCEEAGCPRGKWGVGCKEECSCQNGGFCNAEDGQCDCTRGFKGEACEEKCGAGTFGENCNGTCECGVGEVCHFITGECTPCVEGRFGEKCASECDCNGNNTAHCDNIDGQCVCLSNYFGEKCDLHCPFGMINGTCYISPIINVVHDVVKESCECANDLFVCDDVRGCICPAGVDCGIEQLNHVNIGFLTKDPSRIGAIVAVVAVVIVGLIVIIVIIIYYRRRLKGMKKDLTERSDGIVYHEKMENNMPRENNMPIRSIAELNMDELGAPLPPVQLSVQDLPDSVFQSNPLYQHTHNFQNNTPQQQQKQLSENNSHPNNTQQQLSMNNSHPNNTQHQQLSANNSYPNNIRPVKTTNIVAAQRIAPSFSPQKIAPSLSSAISNMSTATSSGYSSVSDLYKDHDFKNNIDMHKVAGKNDECDDDIWNGYENLEEAEYDQPKEPSGIAKQICKTGDDDDDYDELEDEENYDHLDHQRSNNDLSARYHSTKSNALQQPLNVDLPPGVPPRK